MKKLSNYSNYSGIDASNEISLFEYGLLCKIENNDIQCIYGVGSDNGCNYNTFACSWISATEVKQLLNELDKLGLLSYIGMSEKNWLESDIITQIHDLLSYFGYENIFGCYHNSFEIENK